VGQVSFMLDLWSDQGIQPFLAITAHWVARVDGTLSLQLKTSLIVFHCVHHNHSGRSLAQTILYLLDRAGVMMKVRRPHFSDD